MPRQLSIGIVTPTVSRAGGGIFPIVLAHAHELSNLGHDVTIYGLNDDPEALDRDAWGGLVLRLYDAGLNGYSPALKSDLEAGDHDLVHQHGLWMYLSIAVSSWRARTDRPVVISTQGMLEPWARSNSAWKKLIASAIYEKRNVRMASVIHCSKAELAGVREYVPSSRIAVIPNGTQVPEISKNPPAPSDLFPSEKRMLLFFGRLHPKKGVAELIQAWAILRENGPDIFSNWRLVVAGWDDGGHAETYHSLAQDFGFKNDEIQFPGPRFGDAKDALLGNADAFILPSYSEGFPMAVLEAWSHGLPVFMTPECNIPEGFSEGAAIEIPNSPEELGRVLRRELTRPDLPEVGQAGRRLVEQTYSWPRVVSELSNVYEWLVGAAQLPKCLDFSNN